MVEKDYPRLSVAAQCRLLSIPRSTFYHRPAGESAENLCLMALIDRQFTRMRPAGTRGEGEIAPTAAATTAHTT